MGACSSHLRRGGDDDDGVEAVFAAGLVQERDLDDADLGWVGSARDPVAPPRLRGHHPGVEQPLQPGELLGSAEDDACHGRAVDAPVLVEHALAEA